MIFWWRQLWPRMRVDLATAQKCRARLITMMSFRSNFNCLTFDFSILHAPNQLTIGFYCVLNEQRRSSNWRLSTANNQKKKPQNLIGTTCWSVANPFGKIRIANKFRERGFTIHYKREVFDEFTFQLWDAIENFSFCNFPHNFSGQTKLPSQIMMQLSMGKCKCDAWEYFFSLFHLTFSH